MPYTTDFYAVLTTDLTPYHISSCRCRLKTLFSDNRCLQGIGNVFMQNSENILTAYQDHLF